jgi:hypothetical protein
MAVAIGTMNGIGTHGWWQDDGIADVMTEPGTGGFWMELIVSGGKKFRVRLPLRRKLRKRCSHFG